MRNIAKMLIFSAFSSVDMQKICVTVCEKEPWQSVKTSPFFGRFMRFFIKKCLYSANYDYGAI